MKKHLSILVAGALAVWFVAMSVHYAGASPEKWKLEVMVTTKDGDAIKLTYGNPKDGVHWFPSEAACKQLAADPASDFAPVWKKLQALAKARGDKLDKPLCVMVLDDA